MADHAVELNVAGQKCRVVSSADEEELTILARMVEEKLARILPKGRPVTTQAVILAAVALANDVRTERDRADAIATKAKTSLEAMLARVESVLETSEATGSPASRKGNGPRSVGGAAVGGEAVGGASGSTAGGAGAGARLVPAAKSRHDAQKRSDGESSKRFDGD